MVFYLLLCLTSVLTGFGILAVARVKIAPIRLVFLTPVLTLSFIIIVMGGLIAGGFSVGQITPIIYALCLSLAAFGAYRHGIVILTSWRSLLAVGILPLVILMPAIVQGIENYSGGLCMDGWSYVTAGQAMQRYPLGSEGWLPIDAQYLARWGKDFRFVSSSFLALLAPLGGTENDTQTVLGHYLGWLFFVYSSACMFFTKAIQLDRLTGWIYVALATLSGWMLRIVNCNSIDNAVAISFLPTFFGLLLFMNRPSVKYGIALGALLGAELYAYPVAAPFMIAALSVLVLQRLLESSSSWRDFIPMVRAFGVTLLICTLPFAAQMWTVLAGESRATGNIAGQRPGDVYYHSLLVSKIALSGFWALLPDFPGAGATLDSGNDTGIAQTVVHGYNSYANGMAFVLTGLAAIGLFQLLRAKRWGPFLFVVGMTSAYVFFLARAHYPYAAYKVLVLSWFSIAYTVILGLQSGQRWLSATFSPNVKAQYSWAGLLLVATTSAFFFFQAWIFYRSLPFKSVREYRRVSEVANLAHGGPVALIAHEGYANIWGLHFLRNTKLFLAGQYAGYMLNEPRLLRTQPVDPSAIHLLVTDNGNSAGWGQLISRPGPYWVWECRHKACAAITEIDNANGVEGPVVDPFFWIGKGDTELHILANAATTAFITANFSVGPSLPGESSVPLRIFTTDGVEQDQTISNGTATLTVPLHPGLNRVIIRPLDCAKTLLANDPRPLLLEAAHFSVSTSSTDEFGITEVQTPNGIDLVGNGEFFWMGGGDTVVTINSPATAIAELKADIVPGPSLADQSSPRLLVLDQSGGSNQPNLNWGAVSINVPVVKGLNRVVLRPLGLSSANITAPGDPRVMMIGASNYKVAYMESKHLDDLSGANCKLR